LFGSSDLDRLGLSDSLDVQWFFLIWIMFFQVRILFGFLRIWVCFVC